MAKNVPFVVDVSRCDSTPFREGCERCESDHSVAEARESVFGLQRPSARNSASFSAAASSSSSAPPSSLSPVAINVASQSVRGEPIAGNSPPDVPLALLPPAPESVVLDRGSSESCELMVLKTPLRQEHVMDPSQGSQRGQTSARNPILPADANTDTTSAQGAEGPRDPAPDEVLVAIEPSIDMLISQCQIHVHRPIESLPPIAARELQAIGQFVSFLAESECSGKEQKLYYYEGLLSSMTKDVVVLMHVHRFTVEAFKLRKKQLDAIIKQRSKALGALFTPHEGDGRGAAASASTISATPHPILGGNVAGESPEGAEVVRRKGRLDRILRRGSSTPAVDRAEAEARAFHEMMAFDFPWPPPPSSSPSLPSDTESVTLSEIAELDPQIADFDEAKELQVVGLLAAVPLQIPRASAAESPSASTRRSYIPPEGCAGPFPCISFTRTHIRDVEFAVDPPSTFFTLFRSPERAFFDVQCLRTFVRRYLVHTSQGNNTRAIPLLPFVAYRGNCGQHLDVALLKRIGQEEMGSLAKISAAIESMNRPGGSDSNIASRIGVMPGITSFALLFRTGIPTRTFITSLIHAILASAVAIILITSFTSVNANFTARYVQQFAGLLTATSLVYGCCAGVTCAHAVRMALPVSKILFSLRLTLIVASFVMLMVSAVQVGEAVFNKDTLYAFYLRRVWVGDRRLCDFFYANSCCGFFVHEDSSSLMCSRCYYDDPIPSCSSRMRRDISSRLIPVFGILVASLCLLLYDLYLCYAIYFISARLHRYVQQ